METQQQEHLAPLRPTSLEEARAMVDRTIEQIPAITPFGIEDRDMVGSFDQRTLYSEKSLRMVCVSADWFRSQMRRSHWVQKSKHHHLSSYTFKTAIEGFCGHYVSNGAVTVAACGLRLEVTTRPLDPNATIRLIVQENTENQAA
jgi:hypothetical protein